MDLEARRDLQVLEAVSENQRITQRSLATRLGIALGLTNIYLKRLVRKGYIKCVNVQSNRILYLITPRGLAEKTRLTYEFMEYSLRLYRQVRQHLRAVLQPCAENGLRHIAIYGVGEPAELAYLALRELGLEPVAIFDSGERPTFLGMQVRDISEHHLVAYDVLIVATLDRRSDLVGRLLREGVAAEKLLPLRPDAVVEAPRE